MTLPALPPLPFLGRSGGLARLFRDPLSTLARLRALGDVAAIHLGKEPLIAAFGAEHNRQLLSDAQRFHNFASVPFPIPPGSSAERLFQALTAMNGDQHRRHRRLMMPAFSKAALAGYHGEMLAATDAALARWRPGQRLDVAAEMIDLTLRIALRCLFGLSEVAEVAEFGDLALGVLGGVTDARNLVAPLDWPGTPYRRFLRVSERMEARTRELIAARRARPDAAPDVLSRLIDAHDEDGSALTDDELVGQATVLFIAGHETTAFTLAWTLLLLAEHPGVAAELAEELDRELAGGPPTPDSAARLTLLDATIKESMRLLPATPFLFLRDAREPFSLGGHPLPAGSFVVLSPLLTHREQPLWPDPQRFDPTRWQRVQPTPWEYLPFGAGPRMCLGAGFAAQALRVVLPRILQRFHPSLVPGTRIDLRTQGITMGPKPGIPMILRAREEGPGPAVPVGGRIRELVDLPMGGA